MSKAAKMHRGRGSTGSRPVACPSPPPAPHRVGGSVLITAEEKTRLQGSRRRRPRSTRSHLRGVPRTTSPRTWKVNTARGGDAGQGRPLGRDGDRGTMAWPS